MMLARLQPRHPDVQVLERQLVDLRERWTYTPQFIRMTSTSGDADEAEITPPTEKAHAELQMESSPGGDLIVATPSPSERWMELRQNYDDAIARRERMERANEESLHRLLAQTRRVQSWSFSMPQLVERIGGRVPRRRFGLVLLLAAAGATATFWLSGRRGGSRNFRDIAEVEAATNLPTLVAIGDEPIEQGRPSRAGVNRTTRTLVVAAELIVATLLLVLMIDLCRQSATVGELLRHPWDTPGNLVMRIVAAWTA
jgi:hypothetical protein